MNRERALDVAAAVAVATLKLAASIVLVEVAGFRQISDDDYARTVIAQGFAAAPRFDPSGTSWLPFPFWLTGSAMFVFGRSIEVARTMAFIASAAGAAGFFVVLRAACVSRVLAIGASLIVGLGAWNSWLGAAPVPEGFVGPLMAVGALALLVDDSRALVWGGLALLVCTLSRYEAWPLAATFALAVALRARSPIVRSARAHAAIAIALAVLGPLVWLAWNAHIHGNALHFLDRVTRYRATIGAAGAPLLDKLLVYPAAWLRAFPEGIVLALVGVYAIVQTPRRFAPLAIAMTAVLGFLIAGEVGEGAPTHHPERALVSLAWIAAALAAFAIDAAHSGPSRRWFRGTVAGGALAALVFVLRLPLALDGYPGQGDADRRAQVERGRALRGEGATALTVVPCAYEHFALLAAYGAPERVTVTRAPEKQPVTETCPKVEVRQ